MRPLLDSLSGLSISNYVRNTGRFLLAFLLLLLLARLMSFLSGVTAPFFHMAVWYAHGTLPRADGGDVGKIVRENVTG